MKTYNSREDIKRYVHRQIENFDMSCYPYEFDELLELITDHYEDFLCDKLRWSYGEEIPEISDIDYDIIFHQVEN